MKTKYIPDGYHTATPYLIVNGGARAIDFYKQAFGATEVMRMPGPGGKVMHAEVKIGDSRIMLADEFPEMDARGPQSIGGTPVSLPGWGSRPPAVGSRLRSVPGMLGLRGGDSCGGICLRERPHRS